MTGFITNENICIDGGMTQQMITIWNID